MALNLKLQMRLSQQLIMTPQLQQAIKLLQLSRNELEELIDQALIENPVLEEADENTEPADEPGELKARVEAPETLTPEPGPSQAELEWQQYKEAGGGVIPERHRGEDGEDYGLEATLAGTDTLQDHLLWQTEMSGLSPLECAIAEYLIGNIEDEGYLTLTVEELLQLNPELHSEILTALAAGKITVPVPESLDSEYIPLKFQAAKAPPPAKKLKQPPVFEEDEAARSGPAEVPAAVDPKAVAVVEGIVRFIQTLDPTGAGSRCLKECLEVQLRQAGLEDGLAFRMVAHDLKLLESKDLRKIARRQKAALEDVIEAYKLIMALEPKPGRPFATERPQHIIPDVYIYKFSSGDRESDDQVGQFRLTLNDSGIPRLRINSYYRDLANGRDAGASLTKEYIQEKIKAGNWLMKSIEQRQRTIFRVTKSILKHQYEFFEKGINSLKPLVLKDVAEDIQVHESTVSRITTNKYVHTPQGIFELKYFFTSGIDQGHGEVISSKKIKDLIQKIIVKEDLREPFTDIQIAERLYKEMKIKVARRTVAKYREALNLLPSNKRKQMF